MKVVRLSDSPEKLLSAARSLLERPDARTAGLWPRAAAHLARQALELLLDEFWRTKAPGTENTSTRAQLICLSSYLGGNGLASRVAFAWNALSHACHHHAYELAPTASELRLSLEVAQEFLELTNGISSVRTS
jgi:hypothetical protein